MIASVRGTLLLKTPQKAVIEAAGVGYEILIVPATAEKLPHPGETAMVHVAESVGMYGGGVTLYGFLTPVEKEMFFTFKDCIPSTGAKKALEYLEKASKSLPDFKRAILDKDSSLLCSVFGFTKKTADRLIDALKDRIEAVHVPGSERMARAGGLGRSAPVMGQALSALAALGYKAAEARLALEAVESEHSGETLDVERIIRLALKRL